MKTICKCKKITRAKNNRSLEIDIKITVKSCAFIICAHLKNTNGANRNKQGTTID